MEIQKIFSVVPSTKHTMAFVLVLKRIGQRYDTDDDGVSVPRWVWDASIYALYDTTAKAKRAAKRLNRAGDSWPFDGRFEHPTSTASMGGAGYYAYSPDGGPVFAITKPPPAAKAATMTLWGRTGPAVGRRGQGG